MFLLKLSGLILCFGFVGLILKMRAMASDMTDFCDSLPTAEGWNEEDFDDLPQYRVESDEWLPVGLERQNGTN
jgi:hypothetical protein